MKGSEFNITKAPKTVVLKLELRFDQRGTGDRVLESKLRKCFWSLVKRSIPILEESLPFQDFCVGVYQQRSGTRFEMIGCKTYFMAATTQPAKFRALLRQLANQSKPQFQALLNRDFSIGVTSGYDSGEGSFVASL